MLVTHLLTSFSQKKLYCNTTMRTKIRVIQHKTNLKIIQAHHTFLKL